MGHADNEPDEVTPESLARLKGFARRVVAAPKGKVEAQIKAGRRPRKKPRRIRRKRA